MTRTSDDQARGDAPLAALVLASHRLSELLPRVRTQRKFSVLRSTVKNIEHALAGLTVERKAGRSGPRNKRLQKKELKKRLATIGSSVDLAPTALKILALECWRLKGLTLAFGDVGRQAAIIENTLVRLGVEVEDPAGMPFREGMTLEVALFQETSDLPDGERMITETLAPTIYLNQRIVHPAKVIVLVGTRS